MYPTKRWFVSLFIIIDLFSNSVARNNSSSFLGKFYIIIQLQMPFRSRHNLNVIMIYVHPVLRTKRHLRADVGICRESQGAFSFFKKIQIQISESKSGICVFYCEIHKIHTPGGLFRSNLSQDFLDSLTERFSVQDQKKVILTIGYPCKNGIKQNRR